MKRVDGVGGCVTLKRGFASKSKARKYLRVNAGSSPARRVYACPHCGNWHLTKQRKKVAA